MSGLPDWLAVNARVAILTSGRRSADDRVEVVIVDRFTRTTVVLNSGDKFLLGRPGEIRQRSTQDFGPTKYLLPLSDKRVIDARTAQIRRNTVAKVDEVLARWVDDGHDAEAEKARVYIEAGVLACIKLVTESHE